MTRQQFPELQFKSRIYFGVAVFFTLIAFTLFFASCLFLLTTSSTGDLVICSSEPNCLKPIYIEKQNIIMIVALLFISALITFISAFLAKNFNDRIAREWAQSWARINDKSKNLSESTQALKREKEILQADKVELQKDKAVLQTDKEKLKQDKVLLQTDKVDLQKDKALLQTDKIDLQKDKATLQADKDDLQQDKALLQTDKEELQNSKRDLENEKKFLNKNKNELEKERDNLRQQKDNLESEKSQLQTDKVTLANQTQILQDETEQLANECEQLRLARARAAKIEGKITNLLYKLFPTFIVKDILDKVSKDKEIKNNAERKKNVAILFADIVGFTALSKILDPADVLELLHDYYSDLDEIAADLKLEKIKTSGDSYMVCGGLFSKDDDSQIKEVMQFSQRVFESLDTLNAKIADKITNSTTYSSHPHIDRCRHLSVRMGADIGDVVAGIIGQNKLIYDVWGDAVNMASRMETYAKTKTLRVTKNVKEHLENDNNIIFENEEVLDIKNAGETATHTVRLVRY